MPTENERKYVLECSRQTPGELSGLMLGFQHDVIRQGYLVSKKSVTCRIRSSANNERVSLNYTFKKKVGSRCIEIEVPVDDRDFDDLWGTCKRTLKKIRVYMEGWEVDYFLSPDGGVYFVLAEHEMPEGQDRPEAIIPFVKERLLFEVPRMDDRCSNRKLAKVGYARRLLSSLSKEAR